MKTMNRPATAADATAIPLFVPEIRGNEWLYVHECLDTAWISSVGSFVQRFEGMLAECVGVKYAVATVNGTSALHIAMITAGVQPGDEVLTSSLTFIATANAIRYCGAWPVFLDAEPNYWQMDPNLLEYFLSRCCERKNGYLRNRRTRRRVRAIMPVHILGHPVDMDAVLDLAARYELLVIEDAAEAVGTRYKGRSPGGLGELGCLSFNGNKLVTTGGGGVVLTNDQAKADRARYLTTQAKDDPLEYVHNEMGYNYRLTNVLAAIGCAQLEQLDEFIASKRNRAEQYWNDLQRLPGIEMFREAEYARCTYWMNTIRIDAKQFGSDSRTLLQQLQLRGIQTRPLWQPMHLSHAHRNCESLTTGVADRLYADCLSLPSSVGLTSEDVDRVCTAIRDIHVGRNMLARAA